MFFLQCGVLMMFPAILPAYYIPIGFSAALLAIITALTGFAHSKVLF